MPGKEGEREEERGEGEVAEEVEGDAREEEEGEREGPNKQPSTAEVSAVLMFSGQCSPGERLGPHGLINDSSDKLQPYWRP